jgi:hypothetical protein
MSININAIKDIIVSTVNPIEIWLYGKYARDEQGPDDIPAFCIVVEGFQGALLDYDRRNLTDKLTKAINGKASFLFYSFVEWHAFTQRDGLMAHHVYTTGKQLYKSLKE